MGHYSLGSYGNAVLKLCIFCIFDLADRHLFLTDDSSF